MTLEYDEVVSIEERIGSSGNGMVSVSSSMSYIKKKGDKNLENIAYDSKEATSSTTKNDLCSSVTFVTQKRMDIKYKGKRKI